MPENFIGMISLARTLAAKSRRLKLKSLNCEKFAASGQDDKSQSRGKQ